VKTGNAFPADTSEKCKDASPSTDAVFPGGQENMFFFIMNYLEFPQESIELDEQGKVYLSFFIEPDGTLTEITVLRGVSQSIDREARRIIEAMPRWIPGICNGKESVRK
jgi:protein TonB